MAKKQKKIADGLLFDELEKRDKSVFRDAYQNPNYIKDNLKDNLRLYQDDALRYLHQTQSNEAANSKFNHLLFHMATGSGKTMVMAGAMLYLFKEYNYQNFIFFVHTDAIIQKTKENLLNLQSAKYLFKQNIEIDGQRIIIESVETFPTNPNKNTIYLKLSTIHKIHDELKNTKENSISEDDLKEFKLILLGDEAHHFNAGTRAGKKISAQEQDERTWERTIDKILKLRPENRLFEFTATINLNDADINQKYKDKIIYQYDLKQFMLDGYSKKVMLLEANARDDDKMLDAVLLSQYKKIIAIKNGIMGFKPIVLFKSNQITVSINKQEDFLQIIDGLSPETLRQYLQQKLTHVETTSSIWNKVIHHYLNSDLMTIVNEIKEDFRLENLLNANTKELLADYPILLNTLENIDNPIRAVFAVAKLNEGWDVLNLYDIVRISEKATSTTTATDSEAQLIGRGARYYPFIYNNEKSYTRRFDQSNSELAILEQLHYHTINETNYIMGLHNSLEQADIIAQSDGSGEIAEAKLKESFKKSHIYKNGNIFFNEAIEKEDNQRDWESYSLEKEFTFTYQLSHEENLENLNNSQKIETKIIPLKMDKRYFYKALQQNAFFQFNNLKTYFPMLTSMKEFIESEDYLQKVIINLEVPEDLNAEQLRPIEKLEFLNEALAKIKTSLSKNYEKFSGTYKFKSIPIRDIIKDYSLYIDNIITGVTYQKVTSKNMVGKTWYVYDNAILNQLEHSLIALLDRFMEKLKTRYSNIYVIRNDERSTRFKLTEFNGVRGFMPDFIMVMTDLTDDDVYYQVFLEPKGDDRLVSEKWKENMLEKINDKDLIIIEEDEKVRLVGIKFYAKSQIGKFVKEFETRLFDGNPLIEKTLIPEFDF